jgi:hypothetical protein
VAVSAIDAFPHRAEGASRVSTVRGWWSVVLAVGSPVVGFVLGWALVFALSPIGSMLDPDYMAALRFADIVLFVLIVAMLITAIVFGFTSIARARPQTGRPGRTAAIVLGFIGLLISALVGFLYLFVAGVLFQA